MTTVQDCGFCLTVLFAATVLKQFRPEYGLLVTLAGACSVLLCAVRCLYPAVAFLQKQTDLLGESGGYVQILLRSLGIGLLTQSCADLCRDAGEGALASKLETVGKAELVLLSLPLLRELLDGSLSLFS